MRQRSAVREGEFKRPQQRPIGRRGNRDQDRGRRRGDDRGGDRLAEHGVPRPGAGLSDDPLLVVAPERVDVPADILIQVAERIHLTGIDRVVQ